MKNQVKILKCSLFYLILGLLLNHVCFAASLFPVDSWFGEGILERPFNCALVGPLDCVTLRYDRAIMLAENPKAYIKDGQDIIVEASSFKIRNQISESKSEGFIQIRFLGEILPKGKQYTFCLDSASVHLIDDINVMNSPVSYTLKVPNDMGKAHFSHKNGTIITSTSSFCCNWGYMGGLVGKPQWEFYREGELIGKYPVRLGNDWHSSTACLRFDEIKYFDEGVRYRLVLPAGSVSAYDDIVNREETLEFIGGATKPKSVPFYVFNSVETTYDKKKKLYTQKYPYRRKIKLVAGKTVVYTVKDGEKERKWEVVPTLSREGPFWILTVAFRGVNKKDLNYLTIDFPFDIVEWDNDEP